jgi:hypothetical protein
VCLVEIHFRVGFTKVEPGFTEFATVY